MKHPQNEGLRKKGRKRWRRERRKLDKMSVTRARLTPINDKICRNCSPISLDARFECWSSYIGESFGRDAGAEEVDAVVEEEVLS